MIVPELWAEATVKLTVDGKRRTLIRFGWSDLSQAEADENADARVEEAATAARRGEQVRNVDHKLSYTRWI